MKVAEGTATSAEQHSAMLVALERELEGYKARLTAIEAGIEDRLSKERLTKRVAEVQAEIKRVTPLAKKDK